MDPHHDHPASGPCLPGCPAWADWALELFALQRRFPEMLEACREAVAIEYLDVSPGAQGIELPDYLQGEDVVRLKLVVPRDTPEVFLDEWGIRCSLTFRGERHACALPWHSVLRGRLRPPERKRPRFGVIQGGKKD